MTQRPLLVILLLLTAACGGRETTTEAPPPVTTETTATNTAATNQSVCNLLTMDDLKTAAGIEGAVGESSTSGGAQVCTWTGTNGKVAIVQLFSSTSDYDAARSSFQSMYGTTAQDLSGVGEKAYYLDAPTGRMPTGTLVAQAKAKAISVQIMGGSSAPELRRGEATAVAHLVLGKL